MEQTYVLKNGETLLVRPPKAEDAEACFAYMNRIGKETDFLLVDENGIPGLTVGGERDYLVSTIIDPRIAMFLGFAGERLVAMFDIRPASARPRTAHNATVALSVLRDYWRLGIGSLAMKLMIDAARERGLKNLNLEVNAENVRAVALYERFGFREVGRHKDRLNIRGRFVDEILMDLTL